MQKVLENVLHDVRSNRRFDTLREEINNIAKKQEDEHNLEVNAQIWQSQAEQLQKLLDSDKKANEEDKKETMHRAQQSDAQVDQTIFLNSAKLSKRTGHLNATFDVLSPSIAVLCLKVTWNDGKIPDWSRRISSCSCRRRIC